MIGIALAVLAAAVGLVRRPSPISMRLRVLQGRFRHIELRRPAFPRTGTAVLVAGVGGAALLGGSASLGFGVAVPLLPASAGAVGGATAAAVLSRAAADRVRQRAESALVASVGSLAADLRAGQHPVDAMAVVDDSAAHHRSVFAVWAVSECSGAPAASVFDRVEQDLRARQTQRREVAAALAGARSTCALLAVLPLLGVGLGAAMGAQPLAVLLAEPRGQLALGAGVCLEAVGVQWTSRIIRAAEGLR